MNANPNYVMRTDQIIVAWNDVPVAIQKKILDGTMTDEDWDSDWSTKPIEDVVSDMLNESETPVAKHTHVWRKEYKTCMIKGCGHTRSPRVTYG